MIDQNDIEIECSAGPRKQKPCCTSIIALKRFKKLFFCCSSYLLAFVHFPFQKRTDSAQKHSVSPSFLWQMSKMSNGTDKKATFVFSLVSLADTLYRTNKKIQCLLQQLQCRSANREDMYDMNLVLKSRLPKLSQKP